MIRNNLDAAMTAWGLWRSSDDLKNCDPLLIQDDEADLMEKAIQNLKTALARRARRAA